MNSNNRKSAEDWANEINKVLPFFMEPMPCHTLIAVVQQIITSERNAAFEEAAKEVYKQNASLSIRRFYERDIKAILKLKESE